MDDPAALPESRGAPLVSPAQLPTSPAVYALYGGQGRNRYPAYVGIVSNLRSRIQQHLVRRDSSIVTGVSAVGLHPDLVTQVRWWTHPRFQEPAALEAAELIAFSVLDPALRSRGAVTDRAAQLQADPSFAAEMEQLFRGASAGTLVRPSLGEALDRIAALERRVATLEQLLREPGAEAGP